MIVVQREIPYASVTKKVRIEESMAMRAKLAEHRVAEARRHLSMSYLVLLSLTRLRNSASTN